MSSTNQYVPQPGDRVAALGQNGTFKVLKVYEQGHTADLKLIGANFQLDRIPWGALSLLLNAREDVNQAAARIVREATERD
jgi:hypothetical protein